MKRKRYGAEEIVRKLSDAEVAQAEEKTIAQICQKLEISELTYHRWKKQYGGLSRDETKRLKKLEHENARIKKMVVEQALDIDILKDLAKGNFLARPERARPRSS